ncbi:DsrE family protein [uncultured Oscillibacter sp.]|uniref:DsrE family protein n=1 Tax=uncultured Oscillibacter sp. TaxID=876091 RepID=UPI0025FE59E9|nr:DsrE family protein [uncultured Oscillibacter sp.]
MKVLLHIDDSARWAMTLGNAANLLQYAASSGTPLILEIVANGPAVRELRAAAAEKLGMDAQLESLAPSVRICACENALRANGISAEELYPFVQVVPAGVAELALRQDEGFAYIKP